jgi:hypothetical protein
LSRRSLAPGSTFSRSTGAGAALAGYALLTLALTYPLVRQFASAIPGDAFDGWQNYWNLWWVRQALLVRHSHPYFTPVLFHPTGVSLFFHTLNPFNGLVSLPVQLAWGLLPAYNGVVILSFALGGLGAFLLARQALGRRGRWLPAFVAGAIFTFSPFHVAHLLGHMQVISLEWIPFYALYLLRLTRVPDAEIAERSSPPPAHRRHDALMATFFLVLVALCDWYYVLYCLLLTAVVFAWAAWRAWRTRTAAAPTSSKGLARLVLTLAGVWLAFALILSPLLLPMVREASQHRFMVPDPEQSRILSADLLAFVTPQEFHPLWGEWARGRAAVFTATVSEHQVFLGFSALILLILALLAPGARQRGPWLWVWIAFFVLSLGPVLHVAGQTTLLPGGRELPLPYAALVRLVPFMEITRSVSRLDAIVMLATAVLAAIGLQWLMERGRRGLLIGGLALALVLFEFLPAPYPMSPPDTPSWYAELAQTSGKGAVLNLPMNWDRPGYLLYQTVHGKPLTVAYISRDDPRTLTERVPVLQHFRHLGPDIIRFDLARQGLQVLNDLDVGWVVLDRYKMPGGEERAYTESAAAEIFAGHPPAYQDDRITAYAVPKSEAVAPYLMLGEGWGPFDASTTDLRSQGSRVISRSAEVIVHSPGERNAVLRVLTDPTGGAPDLPGAPGAAGQWELPIQLRPGANSITIRALSPNRPVVVTELALAP